MTHMGQIRQFDHVGITVSDLDAAAAFFESLGFAPENRMMMEGEFVDAVIGIPGSRSEILTLRLPGGGTSVELSCFVHPEHTTGSAAPMSTEVGIRNLCFEVDDLHEIVERLAQSGYGLVGGIGEWEGAWRMTYVRGPDGIIVALAENLGRDEGTG